MDDKIAIVTDSACDLPDELLQRYNIHMVPLRIVYAQKEYRDRVEITAGQVYDSLAREIPKSTLPLPEDVTGVFDRLKAQGYTQALYLSLSSGLSGSYNMVRLLAEQYEGLQITVLDTMTLSMGLGLMVLAAADGIARRSGLQEILACLRRVRGTMTGLFVIRTLEYLRKGGRIGLVEGTVGTLLGIKPVIYVSKEGVYQTLARVRGRAQSIRAMVEEVVSRYADKPIILAVVHGEALEEAKQVLDTLRGRLDVRHSFLEPVSPVLGVHTGPGLIGVIAHPIDPEA